MSKRTAAKPQQLSNLYRFIRLVVGDSIPDNAIAVQWNMNNKNFSEFKYGRYPVPRFERLVSLAKVLGVDDHLIYEVAKGKPAERIYRLINTPAGRKKLVKTVTVMYSTGKLIQPNKLLPV